MPWGRGSSALKPGSKGKAVYLRKRSNTSLNMETQTGKAGKSERALTMTRRMIALPAGSAGSSWPAPHGEPVDERPLHPVPVGPPGALTSGHRAHAPPRHA